MVYVVRLMGRTGVCADVLDDATTNLILDWCINTLAQKEFIDVLLPWVSEICERQFL
jgi:hypothetical protein